MKAHESRNHGPRLRVSHRVGAVASRLVSSFDVALCATDSVFGGVRMVFDMAHLPADR